MKKKKATDRSHRPAAINHSMTASDTQWRIDRTSAAADLQGGYVDDWDQTKRTKVEFQRLANSLARLGRKGRKEDVINLMAWEIGDLRRAIAHAAANPKEGDRDEVR